MGSRLLFIVLVVFIFVCIVLLVVEHEMCMVFGSYLTFLLHKCQNIPTSLLYYLTKFEIFLSKIKTCHKRQSIPYRYGLYNNTYCFALIFITLIKICVHRMSKVKYFECVIHIYIGYILFTSYYGCDRRDGTYACNVTSMFREADYFKDEFQADYNFMSIHFEADLYGFILNYFLCVYILFKCLLPCSRYGFFCLHANICFYLTQSIEILCDTTLIHLFEPRSFRFNLNNIIYIDAG